MTIRKVNQHDIVDLKEVLNSSDLFPSEMLEDMIADYFTNPTTLDIWFTVEEAGRAISLGYCAPEKLTNGTYNLYAIALGKSNQGKGIGRKMMEFIEKYLINIGANTLIVDTSSAVEFELTREFYLKCGYTHEATIRDFWDQGEDKIIFWKSLKS